MPIFVSEEAYGAEILLEVRTTRDSILSNPDLSPVPLQGQWSTQSPSATLGRQRVSGLQLVNWVMASPNERRLPLAIRFLVLTALTSAQSEDVVSVLKFLCGFLDDKRCWRVVTLELTETLTHLDQLTVDTQRYLFSSNIIPVTVLALVLLEGRSSVEDELECLTESETEEGEVNGGLRTISGWIGAWKSQVIDRAVASIDAQDCVDNFLSRLLATADLHPPQAPLTFSTQFVLNLVASEELQKLLHTKPNSAGSVACFCLGAIKQLLGFANVQVYLNAATTQIASTTNPFFEDEPSDVLRRKTSAALSKLTALQPPLKALKDCFEYLWAHFRPVICRQVGRLLPFFLAQVSTSETDTFEKAEFLSSGLISMVMQTWRSLDEVVNGDLRWIDVCLSHPLSADCVSCLLPPAVFRLLTDFDANRSTAFSEVLSTRPACYPAVLASVLSSGQKDLATLETIHGLLRMHGEVDKLQIVADSLPTADAGSVAYAQRMGVARVLDIVSLEISMRTLLSLDLLGHAYEHATQGRAADSDNATVSAQYVAFLTSHDSLEYFRWCSPLLLFVERFMDDFLTARSAQITQAITATLTAVKHSVKAEFRPLLAKTALSCVLCDS